MTTPTSPSSREPARYRFAPRDRTGWLLGLSGPQCVLLGAGLAAGGVVLPYSPPAALALLCAAVVAAFATWDHQPAHQQVVLRAGWQLRRWTGRTRWLSPHPFHQRTSRSPQLSAGFGRLRFWTTGCSAWPGRHITVLEDQAEHTFTIVVPAAGRGFGLLDPGDQERLLAGWGDLLGGFTGTRHPVVRITVSEWAGPTPATIQSSAESANPDAVAAYQQMVEAAGPSTSRHETLLALTVTPPAVRRRDRRRVPGVEGVTVAVEQARLLAGRLDSIGIDTQPPLDAGQLAGLLRTRLDPTHHRRGQGVLGRSGPLALRARWDHVQVDQSVHAVFWVSDWPRLPVGPTWLEPLLLHPGGTRTLTFLLEPVPAAEAGRQVRRDATRLAADEQQRERGGWRVGAEHHRTRAEVEQRETELAAGFAELNYLALLTVTAANPTVLAEACREFEDAASQVGVELRRLDGRHDHALPVGLGFLGRPVPRPRLR